MAFPMEADLPPGLACLKDVDTLLRCPICFDFLNISMMTKCSHNFCSLCIRKFLSYKLQCPVCNTKMTESDLRNNRLLDDLVVNFQAARQQLSKVNFDSPPISPKTPAMAVKCKTPRKRDQKCNGSVLSHFFLKKPETASRRKSQRDGCAAQWEKILAAPTRCEKDADLHSGRAPLSAAVKEEPMSVETSCLSLMSVKQEETSLFDISSELQNAHSSVDVKPVIKVECPVCSVCVSPHFINKHLDTCLTRGEKKESLRSSFGKTRRPMGKLVYNLLSVQELKRRLKECHLSMQGARDQLIRRHQDFVHLYNAQCDALNPKSAEDIAKEVEANEKIRNQLHGKSKPVMVFSKNQSEKEIEEMHSNYRKQHSSDFSRLIAQVRGRLETSKHTHVKQEVSVEEEEAHKASSADEVAAANSLVVMKEEDEDEEQQTVMSSSPGGSDVSISSSLSDIFGPELHVNLQDTETSGCRGDDAVSPSAPGKRRKS